VPQTVTILVRRSSRAVNLSTLLAFPGKAGIASVAKDITTINSSTTLAQDAPKNNQVACLANCILKLLGI